MIGAASSANFFTCTLTRGSRASTPLNTTSAPMPWLPSLNEKTAPRASRWRRLWLRVPKISLPSPTEVMPPMQARPTTESGAIAILISRRSAPADTAVTDASCVRESLVTTAIGCVVILRAASHRAPPIPSMVSGVSQSGVGRGSCDSTSPLVRASANPANIRRRSAEAARTTSASTSVANRAAAPRRPSPKATITLSSLTTCSRHSASASEASMTVRSISSGGGGGAALAKTGSPSCAVTHTASAS